MADISKIKLPAGEFDLKDAYAREQLRRLLGGAGDTDDGESGSLVPLSSDYVTPQAYGAKGDGETDDYEAFRKMLDAEPTYVYIPAGRYYVSKPLTLKALTRTIRGAGIGSTTIYHDAGFLTTGDTVTYFATIEDLCIQGKKRSASESGLEIGAGYAIEGKFVECRFRNLRIWYADVGLRFTGNTWINRFDGLDIAYCGRAIRPTTESFNNNVFFGCVLQYNEYAFYTDHQTQSLVFDSCDVERNTTAFSMKDALAFSVRNSHIEVNSAHVVEIRNACYGADYTFDGCFLFGEGTEKGWLGLLPSAKDTCGQLDKANSVLNFRGCYIRCSNADHIGNTFAFSVGEAGAVYSHVAVCIHGCRFYHRPDTYFDLFDLTNCRDYGDCYNRLPIDTDLAYYKTDTCTWYVRSGNTYDKVNRDTVFELFGYLVPVNANASSPASVTVTLPTRVTKIDRVQLGGVAMAETKKGTGSGTDAVLTGGACPVILSRVNAGGILFVPAGDAPASITDKVYVSGLRY